MSGFSIGNLQRPVAGQVAGAQAGLDAQGAHDQLAGYAAHLRLGKGVKAGVLRLVDGSAGDTRIYRDRAFHFRSRSRDQGVQHAGQVARQLFASAYEGKLSAGAYRKLMDGLDQYLESRGGQMGTRSFDRFFRVFEAAVSREQAVADAAARLADGRLNGPVKLTGAALAQLLGHASEDGLSALSLSTPQSRQAEQVAARQAASASHDDEGFAVVKRGVRTDVQQAREGTAAAFGLSNDSIKTLPHGASSQAFALHRPGEADTVAVIPLERRDPISKDSFGTGELAAALARSPMSHVSKPTEFVLTVSNPLNEQLSQSQSEGRRVGVSGEYTQAYRVPADGVRAFFDQVQAMVPEGSPTPSVSIAAVRMPAGPSTNLSKAVAGQPLNAQEFSRFAAGFYLGVDQMGRAGLLHHDLKPENVVFDRSTGRTMLIDMGGAVKLNEGGSTRTIRGRNDLTMPPSVRQEGSDQAAGTPIYSEHGREYDRYGYAVTLMTSLSPALDGSLAPTAFAKAFAAPQAGPDGRVGDLLAALGSVGDDRIFEGQAPASGGDPAMAERLLKVEAELRVAFERDPDARKILEQSLAAGLARGAASDQAWNALRAMLADGAIRSSASSADIAALNRIGPPLVPDGATGDQMPIAGDPSARQKGAFLNSAQGQDPYGD
jgi:hypothetical protein